jgi:hypothetical protein
MKKKLFREFLESVKEAAAMERGERGPSRKFAVKRGKGIRGIRGIRAIRAIRG